MDAQSAAADPFRWAQATDIGKLRAENQDACLTDPRARLFAVSDGMGGHQGGATAARLVTEHLPGAVARALKASDAAEPAQIEQALALAIDAANRRVFEASLRDPQLDGMGTTLVMVWLTATRAYIAHVGDSRAYLFRDGVLQQLTADHSLAAMLVKQGLLRPEAARRHPARHQLARCIGASERAEAETRSITLQPRDRLLLCSDGLTGMVADADIAASLARHADPAAACKALVDAANAAGGRDNISVLLVDWLGLPVS